MSGLEFQLVSYVMSWGVNSYVAAQVIVYGTALAVSAYAGSRIAEQKQKEIEK